MVTPVNGIFGVGALAGVALCLLGYYSYREHDELGVGAFSAFVVLLGGSAVAGGALGIAGVTAGGSDGFAIWPQAAILLWAVSALPWVLFAARYTGRFVDLQRRRVALLAVPYLGLVPGLVLLVVDIGTTTVNIVTSVVFVYCLALVLVGVYLLVRTTYRYGQFSVRQGTTLSVAPVGTLIVLNALSILTGESELGAAVLFTAVFALSALSLAIAVWRQDVFAASPAAGTLGERTVLRETDDIVFVVDDHERPVRLNQTAVETLGVSRDEAFNGDLVSILGYDVDTLQQRATVSLDTGEGVRQYDPQVSVFEHGDCELGALVDLRDVTDRELREQRLSVLNRVLRHNLRNKVEVLKARTEVLDEDLDGEYTTHTRTLAETAEDIAKLGRNARRIDQFVAEDTEETTVDVVESVSETLDTVDTNGRNLEITLDTPESLSVETNRRALAAALRSALDNATTYADSEVTVSVEPKRGYCSVRIADDGPGIPSGELDSLDSGDEAPLSHSTGLGLWQLKWAVTTLGGGLSFDTSKGTTVEITIPDRSGEA
jgi:signal transduction histidine kinase